MGLVGRALRKVHAGESHLVFNDPKFKEVLQTLAVSSPAFAEGEPIPQKYAGEGVGENISPPLTWSNVPENAKELALVIQDPSAPTPLPIVHCVVVGISVDKRGFAEGELSKLQTEWPVRADFALGLNTFNQRVYAGPKPVVDHGPHTYVFQLFALDKKLEFTEPPDRSALLKKLHDAVIERGRLDGTYERKSK